MTTINRQTIGRYEQAKAELSSLVKETAQVGAGFLTMLLLTGGQPPAYIVTLSFFGGVAFVAWSEHQRLTKSEKSHQEHQDKIKLVIETETGDPNLAEDLARGNLVGRNLSGFNLSNADLRQVDLRRADLSNANLSHARLVSAKLSRADLMSANLSNAHLNYADLSYANLKDAKLNNADLMSANLCRADLSSADLRNANLSYSNLTGVDLSSANVEKAEFAYNLGLSEKTKSDLKERGAIFPDTPPIPV